MTSVILSKSHTVFSQHSRATIFKGKNTQGQEIKLIYLNIII